MYDPGAEKRANEERIARNNPDKYGMNIHLDPETTRMFIKYYAEGAKSDSDAFRAILDVLGQIGMQTVQWSQRSWYHLTSWATG